MRAFVITDSSKRKAKPLALLLWRPDANDGPGEFELELSSKCSASNLPLSLSFCADRPGRRATPEQSRQWVRSRIVPEDRQNIAEVLRENGLPRYDEASLLALGNGRSSDDDCLAYEIELPDGLLERIASDVGADSRADRGLKSVKRKRCKSEISYSLMRISEEPAAGDPRRTSRPDGSNPENALSPVRAIGEQIRNERKRRGITQTQLAARAGIAQPALSRIESGIGNPTLGLLEEIAAALDMQLDVLLR